MIYRDEGVALLKASGKSYIVIESPLTKEWMINWSVLSNKFSWTTSFMLDTLRYISIFRTAISALTFCHFQPVGSSAKIQQLGYIEQ